MQAITNFLSGIGDAIIAVFDFVVSFFSDLIYMIQMLGQIAVQLPSYFAWLPSELLAGLTLIFTLVVLYKILGREG